MGIKAVPKCLIRRSGSVAKEKVLDSTPLFTSCFQFEFAVWSTPHRRARNSGAGLESVPYTPGPAASRKNIGRRLDQGTPPLLSASRELLWLQVTSLTCAVSTSDKELQWWRKSHEETAQSQSILSSLWLRLCAVFSIRQCQSPVASRQSPVADTY